MRNAASLDFEKSTAFLLMGLCCLVSSGGQS
ncbi:hypothetical protein FHY08_001263 [Pseudomonas koreensis]|nr:hypothetical protein [Pseudomonas koreensis]